MSKTVKVVEWTDQPNLGDRFTDLLLTKWGYKTEVTNKYAEGNFIGVGSLLEQCAGHPLTIWGTGRVTDSRETGLVDLTRANVLALRGPLSAMGSYGARSQVNLRKGFALGDPGLLAEDLLGEPPDDIRDTVYVPHWSDYEKVKELRPEACVVNLLGDPIQALEEIRMADKVVSSSLHGIVFADAFGVERVWEYVDSVPGKGFKFRDYGSLVGRFEPGDSVKVADSIISGIQTELREVVTRWLMNAGE